MADLLEQRFGLIPREGSETLEPIAAAVLAGGASRRLGSDKALLRLFGGRPLLQVAVEKLAEVSDEVLVVTGTPDRYRSMDVAASLISDRWPGLGPLTGIHAALRAAAAEYVLIIACDMPFLDIGLLR